VFYAYNHHVRLLSPEPVVVDKSHSTRVEGPTLLCNQVVSGFKVRQAWTLFLIVLLKVRKHRIKAGTEEMDMHPSSLLKNLAFQAFCSDFVSYR
jgi:hypothetical protein